MLKVTVQKASGLPDVDTFGKSDPFVIIKFQGNEQKTEVQKDTLDPVWNQDLQWDLGGKPLSPDDTLVVEVKDYEKIKIMRKLLGKVDVPLGELLSSKEAEREYDLLDGKNKPTMGKLCLRLQYDAPPGSEPETTGGGEEREEEEGEGDEDEDEEEEGVAKKERSLENQDNRRKRKGKENELDEEEESGLLKCRISRSVFASLKVGSCQATISIQLFALLSLTNRERPQ
ncbi:dysferlin-like [Acropora millepora]|uniref:dysferlin-like n=1 Tax=Acropora millepora TaxID=45264 RepID=UPI001CF296E8|nr:dysferlin-like [Acropora millepora]